MVPQIKGSDAPLSLDLSTATHLATLLVVGRIVRIGYDPSKSKHLDRNLTRRIDQTWDPGLEI